LYALGPQLPKIITIFLMPIVTKYLTPNDYAISGITMAYIGAISGLRELGFQQIMANYFYRAKGNEKRWKPFWKQHLGILLLWGIPYSLLLAIVLYFGLKNHIKTNFSLFLIVSILPALLFDVINSFGFRYYQFAQKPIYPSLVAFIVGCTAIFTTYYCVVHLQLQYWSFFITILVSSFVSFLFFFHTLFFKAKIIPTFLVKKRQLKRYFKVSLPTIPHNYSAYLLNASDRVVLDMYKIDTNKIGQYNFAYTFGMYAEIIGNAIGMAVGPVYLKFYANRNETGYNQAKLLTFFLQLLFMLFSFIGCLWMFEVFKLLASNKDLVLAYPLAIIVVMGYSYRPMYWACISRLGFEEKTNQLWKISMIGGLLNVILNIIFIPIWGVYGSAIATFIGLMYIGFSGFYNQAYKKLNKENYYPLYWLFSIVILGVLAYVLKETDIYIKIIITTIALFGTVAFFLKNKSTFNFLKR
jgi:O-antigen/teichoic acid export membrane protein